MLPTSGEQKAEALLPPAERFPPVEPPTTGFFVQLFVVPALIVGGIMLVWLLLDRYAGRQRTIEEYLAILGNEERKDRWTVAHDLCQSLSQDPPHTRDSQIADRLAAELERALESSGGTDERYRVYLAGALGWFHVPNGVGALLKATGPEKPKLVREAALFALTRLAHRLGEMQDSAVTLRAAEYLQTDHDPTVRECSAYLLLHLGDQRALPALISAIQDPVPGVRFNAANALAALGSEAALQTLREMLDEDGLSRLFRLRDETDQPHVDRETVRMTIWSALGSLRRLHTAGAKADFTGFREQVRLLAGHQDPQIREAAKQLQHELFAERPSVRGKEPPP